MCGQSCSQVTGESDQNMIRRSLPGKGCKLTNLVNTVVVLSILVNVLYLFPGSRTRTYANEDSTH